MLVDDVTIKLIAGHGGRGAVAFNKVRLALGPVGGDGGDGGSIFLEGITDLLALAWFTRRKGVNAENGGNGRGQFIDGKDGADLVLKVPVGSTVTNLTTGAYEEITSAGQQMLAVQGGRGGRGNFKFRSPVNTSPKEFEEGTPGEEAAFRVELKLIADVGLIGLPNAGKSSLLNELTAARARVGSYAFTTLEPNLGAYYGLVIADIPGLIEGASLGRGLGTKFLRHIERTNTLFHLISAESDDPVNDYRTIRAELEKYNPALMQKHERVFLSKSDAVPPDEAAAKLLALKRSGVNAVGISILDPASIERVKGALNGIIAERGV